MEHKHRKAREAEGGELNGSKYLDSLVIRGEHLASFLTRRNMPPQVSLNRVMDLIEKAKNFKHTYKNHGEMVVDTRPSKQQSHKNMIDKAVARLWECYQEILENEVAHPAESGKDESWNGAKRVGTKWVSDPVYFFGDALEEVLADELHGEKAQGIINTKNEED